MDVRPTRETGLPGKTGGALTSESTTECPVGEERLMEEILERWNLTRALDRFSRQAMLQVLQEQWDQTFSEASFGFRPGRGAQSPGERRPISFEPAM